MSEIATAYISLVPSAAKFGTKLDAAIGPSLSGAGKSGGSKISSAIGGVLKKSAFGIGATAGGLLGTALFKGFGRLNALDQAKAKLAGLGNSTKAVDAIMTNALKSVQGTAFGLDEAATTAAAAVAAGIKPGKELTGVLTTVADTATIAGKSMADTGAIFGSVAARGKLQGDDLMQLQSAGVPVLAMLAKHYDTTAAAASEMVSKGEVDFKNFAAAMHENIGGAALKSGGTFQGAYKNMMASLGRIGANLLSGVFPQIQGGIVKLTGFMGSIEPVATRVGEVVGKKLALIAPAVLGLVDKVGPTLGQLGQMLSDAWVALAPTFSRVAKAVAPLLEKVAMLSPTFALFKANADSGGAVLDKVRDVVVRLVAYFEKNLLPAFLKVGDAVGNLATTVLPIIKQIVAGVIARVAPMLPRVADVFQQIGATVKDALDLIANVINVVTKVIEVVWEKFGSTILDYVGRSFSNVITIISGALKIAQGVIRLATSLIKGDWSGAWDAVKLILSGAWLVIKGIVKQGINSLRLALSAGWLLIKSGAKLAWEGIKQIPGLALKAVVGTIRLELGLAKAAAKAAWNAIKAATAAVWGAIKSAVSSYVGNIKSAVGGLAELVGKVRGWFGDVLKAIKNKLASAADEAGKLPGKVKAGLGDLSTTLYDKGKDLIQGLINGAGSLLSQIGSLFLDKVPGWIKGPFKKALGISSPSKVFHGYGVNLMEGLVRGVNARAASAGKAVKNTATKVIQAAHHALKVSGKGARAALAAALGPLEKLLDRRASQLGKKMLHNIAKGMTKGQPELRKKLRAIANMLKDGIDGKEHSKRFQDMVQKVVDSLDKKLGKATDRAQKKVDKLKSKVKDLKSQLADLAAAVVQNYAPDFSTNALFGPDGNLIAGTAVSSFMDQLTAKKGLLDQVKNAYKKLLGEGLNGDWLQQLLASGQNNLILDLAGGSATDALSAQALYQQVQEAADALGNKVANNTSTKDDLDEKKKELERQKKEYQKEKKRQKDIDDIKMYLKNLNKLGTLDSDIAKKLNRVIANANKGRH